MSQLTSRYFRQTYYGGGYQIVMTFLHIHHPRHNTDNYQVAVNHTENHYNSLKGNVNRKGISQRKACFLFFFKVYFAVITKGGRVKRFKSECKFNHISFIFPLYVYFYLKEIDVNNLNTSLQQTGPEKDNAKLSSRGCT